MRNLKRLYKLSNNDNLKNLVIEILSDEYESSDDICEDVTYYLKDWLLNYLENNDLINVIKVNNIYWDAGRSQGSGACFEFEVLDIKKFFKYAKITKKDTKRLAQDEFEGSIKELWENSFINVFNNNCNYYHCKSTSFKTNIFNTEIKETIKNTIESLQEDFEDVLYSIYEDCEDSNKESYINNFIENNEENYFDEDGELVEDEEVEEFMQAIEVAKKLRECKKLNRALLKKEVFKQIKKMKI